MRLILHIVLKYFDAVGWLNSNPEMTYYVLRAGR